MNKTGWIYRWWLVFLLGAMVPLLAGLGIWQMDRATQKQQLIMQIQSNEQVYSSSIGLDLDQFTQVDIEGRYQNEFYWWDNRTSNGQSGYELLVLLEIKHSVYQKALVNLGFIADTKSRTQLPEVPNMPNAIYWQTQVRNVDFGWLQSQLVSGELPIDQIVPAIFELKPGQPYGQQPNWHPVKISPAKHIAYAVQWFALALSLTLAGIILMSKQRTKNRTIYEHSH